MRKRLKHGYIYVIINENFHGFCKIGVTLDIKSRLRSYQTSSPHRNYKVVHYIEHHDCYSAEKQIQDNLKYFALSRKNEWFEIPIQFAIDKVNESLTPKENILS